MKKGQFLMRACWLALSLFLSSLVWADNSLVVGKNSALPAVPSRLEHIVKLYREHYGRNPERGHQGVAEALINLGVSEGQMMSHKAYAKLKIKDLCELALAIKHGLRRDYMSLADLHYGSPNDHIAGDIDPSTEIILERAILERKSVWSLVLEVTNQQIQATDSKDLTREPGQLVTLLTADLALYGYNPFSGSSNGKQMLPKASDLTKRINRSFLSYARQFPSLSLDSETLFFMPSMVEGNRVVFDLFSKGAAPRHYLIDVAERKNADDQLEEMANQILEKLLPASYIQMAIAKRYFPSTPANQVDARVFSSIHPEASRAHHYRTEQDGEKIKSVYFMELQRVADRMRLTYRLSGAREEESCLITKIIDNLSSPTQKISGTVTYQCESGKTLIRHFYKEGMDDLELRD